MKLNQLYDNKGSRYKAKRVGRGIGSGKGKTCGSGVKGQKARSGVAINGFEGGQMPIYRRLPKRGFVSINPNRFNSVNLGVIGKYIESGRLSNKETITNAHLLEVGLIKNARLPVKILAKGVFKQKVDIESDSFSATAVKLIEAAGGKVITASAKK